MYNIIYIVWGKIKSPPCLNLMIVSRVPRALKRASPYYFFFHAPPPLYIIFNTHSHTCHVAHSLTLSCNKRCTFPFFFWLIHFVILPVYIGLCFIFVEYVYSSGGVGRRCMCHARCWSSSENSLSFLVFILVCMAVVFVVENRFLRGDDDGNNNSGYGKLKTCQSFSNSLLCVGEWIGRIVGREDRARTCGTFKCFRIYLHSEHRRSREIRIVCAGIIGIKI